MKYKTKFWKIGLCTFKPCCSTKYHLGLRSSLHVVYLTHLYVRFTKQIFFSLSVDVDIKISFRWKQEMKATKIIKNTVTSLVMLVVRYIILKF